MESYFGDCFLEFELVLQAPSGLSQNGDDAIELFLNDIVIETFGNINTDGTGEDWEYLDSWAYEQDGTWLTAAVNCTDGSNSIFATKINTMYPEEMCAPMREDLTEVGYKELRTAEDVDSLLANQEGTALVVINSVCGCAAGNARPAAKMATQFTKKPDVFATAFAGQDPEATAKAREYMLPFPPSSPSIVLFQDGKIVHFIERHHIEGRSAQMIADNLKDAFVQMS